MSEWQPIETYEPDWADNIIITDGKDVYPAWLDLSRDVWCSTKQMEFPKKWPKKWQPLPPPA